MTFVAGSFTVLLSVLAGDLKRRFADRMGRRYMDRIFSPVTGSWPKVALMLQPGASLMTSTVYWAPAGTLIGIRIRPRVSSSE